MPAIGLIMERLEHFAWMVSGAPRTGQPPFADCREPTCMPIMGFMTRVERDREREDDEIAEAWTCHQNDQVLAVEVVKFHEQGIRIPGVKVPTFEWQVIVPVMEFLREEPLQTETALSVTAAIERVVGVRDVEPEDREVWIVSGRWVGGRRLTRAVGAVLVKLEPRIRAHLAEV